MERRKAWVVGVWGLYPHGFTAHENLAVALERHAPRVEDTGGGVQSHKSLGDQLVARPIVDIHAEPTRVATQGWIEPHRRRHDGIVGKARGIVHVNEVRRGQGMARMQAQEKDYDVGECAPPHH